MIRSIIVVIVLVLFLILTIPMLITVFVFRRLGRHREANALAYFCAKHILFVPMRMAAGTKLEVRGREYLPEKDDDGVLIVGNHCSFFDIILSYNTFKSCTGFVGKKELGKFPIFGSWMLAIGCILLDRDNIRDGIRMTNTAVEHIAYKNSMVIFPEGTRNKDEEEQLVGEFHAGSLRIAQKALCKVVPMTITGSADVLERHFPIIKSRRVIIEYSEPIDVSKLDRAQMKTLAGEVREIILENRKKHVEELGGLYASN